MKITLVQKLIQTSTEVEVRNTYLNNPVVGTEPWFTDHEGSGPLVTQYLTGAGDPTSATGWFGAIASQAYTGLYAREAIMAQAGLTKDQFNAAYDAGNELVLGGCAQARDNIQGSTARTISYKSGDKKLCNFIAIDI